MEYDSLSTSIKRYPDRSLLIVLGSPTKPCIPFWIANVESLERDFSSSPDIIIKNHGNIILPLFICSLVFLYLSWYSTSSLLSSSSFFRFIGRDLPLLSMVCCVVFSSPWLFTQHGALPGGQPARGNQQEVLSELPG